MYSFNLKKWQSLSLCAFFVFSSSLHLSSPPPLSAQPFILYLVSCAKIVFFLPSGWFPMLRFPCANIIQWTKKKRDVLLSVDRICYFLSLPLPLPFATFSITSTTNDTMMQKFNVNTCSNKLTRKSTHRTYQKRCATAEPKKKKKKRDCEKVRFKKKKSNSRRTVFAFKPMETKSIITQ